MQCPQCQYENTDIANFCQQCGQRLQPCCPVCAFDVEPRANFCPSCGHQLREVGSAGDVGTLFATPQNYTPRHLAEKILIHRSALEGERKQVTVLFCDLANSVALAERLGPDVMHALLNRFFALALDGIHRYEGTINQFLGDGFMALFGAPIAYEDHARRAVLAALGLQRYLRERQGEFDLSERDELAVRMGLNTGLVVVGGIGDNLRMDYTAVGDTTNLAARLQQLAEPGTILIGQVTARLVQSIVHLEPLDPLQVKGKTASITAYRVTGRHTQRSSRLMLSERSRSRFTGRDKELAILHELLSEVKAGRGQTVGIVGEAGMGKSRLLFEFRKSLNKRRFTYLEGHCLSYGSTTPYLPVLDIVRHNCALKETDDPETISEKVHLSLQGVGLAAVEYAPYLLHLLGIQTAIDSLATLSPEAIKARVFATLRQMSLYGSQRRPIIFVVEDLHWIDKTSEACFTMLIESLAAAPILFLSTYRPGYRPPWLERSYATQIALQHLTPQHSLAVIRSVPAAQQLADHLTREILVRAEGNPFFLEELIRTLAERDVSATDLAIPDTIQGVLTARIDRLSETSKRLLQIASVLGREVPLHLLEAIWEEPTTLDGHLQELKRLEFLYEQIDTLEPVYVFKHALTQEVAYAGLIAARRQGLHATAGRVLETLYANRLEEVYDRLAYHYARTTEPDKAVMYLICMAEKAARGFAHAEVIETLQEAIEHAKHLPLVQRDHCLLDLVLRQVHSLIFLGRFQATRALLGTYQALVEHLHEPALAGPYYFWLGLTNGLLGDQKQAGQYAQRALDAARNSSDQTLMGKAYYVLSMERYWVGQLQQGMEYGRQAVTLLEHTEDPYWLGMANFYLGLNAFLMGEFTQALSALENARVIGDNTGNPRLQSVAAWLTGWMKATQGEMDVGIALCQRGLDQSPDPLNTAGALGYMGTAYLEQGDAAQAIPLLEQSIQHWQQFRFPQLQGWFTTLLGEAYLLHGDHQKAWELVRQGLSMAQEATFVYGVGVAQRAAGRVLLATGTLAEAECYLKDALQTFTAMSARFEVGRTYLSLAELARAQAHDTVAAQHLTEAHHLFRALQLPTFVDRVTQYAKAHGLSLAQECAGYGDTS